MRSAKSLLPPLSGIQNAMPYPHVPYLVIKVLSGIHTKIPSDLLEVWGDFLYK
jgi:hypothetical protein